MNELDNALQEVHEFPSIEEDLNDILQDNNISPSEFNSPDEDQDIDSIVNEVTESESQEEEGNEESNESTPVEEAEEEVRITPNSPTLLIDDTTSRFSGAEWFEEIKKSKIIIAGVGGIGSNLAFQLARMTPLKIVMYDDDKVERVNMAGQLYGYKDLGRTKVTAMANMIREYTSLDTIDAISDKFSYNSEAGDIMMCGFDNMVARKTFFNSWTKHLQPKSDEDRAKCLFLDGRLSMDTLQILCIRGDDYHNIMRYQKEFLFSDMEADSTVCSMKQTTYLACMIASLMTNLFTNFIAGTLNPIIPYDLPFFTEYEAQSMIFKTES